MNLTKKYKLLKKLIREAVKHVWIIKLNKMNKLINNMITINQISK